MMLLAPPPMIRAEDYAGYAAMPDNSRRLRRRIDIVYSIGHAAACIYRLRLYRAPPPPLYLRHCRCLRCLMHEPPAATC